MPLLVVVITAVIAVGIGASAALLAEVMALATLQG